ncbi:MAG: hypothetical protein ACE5QW_02335 [Thermoplasmata archaeon]
MDYYLFLLGVVLALLGTKLLGLHRFKSNIIWIDVQGEAFPSSLRRMAPEIPGTFPIVGDLRIRISGTSAITRNATSRTKLVRIHDTLELLRDFNHLVDNVVVSIFPGVRVRGPVAFRETESPPPPPLDE